MLKKGTQIIYVPTHANGDTHHPDCEAGFVAHERILPGNAILCRYWVTGSGPRRLRTVANSEATPLETIIERDTVPRQDVEFAMIECGLTEGLHELVKHYLKDALPGNITVRTAKYRKGHEGEIIPLPRLPEWIQSQRKGLPPNCSGEQITLDEITIGNQTIVAGYGPLSRTLMIGKKVPDDFR